MSFSLKVKAELARHIGQSRHCRIAEIAALINMCGVIHIHDDSITIKVQTENASVARKYFSLIKKTFNINIETLIRKNKKLNKKRYYVLYITNSEQAKKVLLATKLIVKSKGKYILDKTINPLIVQSTCCKRAYIRGAFLGAGSLSDPEKAYHMEFVNDTELQSEQLKEIINCFDIDAKTIKRKKYYIVYIKEGSNIVDLLNVMEAHISLMNLENVRIVKEMRNNVNRIVNCETANLNKTVSAAVKQLEDIEFIRDTIGLESLPSNLQEVARYRMQRTDASLKELGMMLDPPVGKSGVNHRLRKISRIVEKIRSQKEGKND